MKKIRILSLDGGGIRGVITATIIEHIENKLKEISNNSGARISDYFDMIVGTSTGGILSCIYLTPDKNNKAKYSASQALEFYSGLGYKIFNASKYRGMSFRKLFNATMYNQKKIESIFKIYFNDLKMHELIKPCIVTTYDLKRKSSFFFNSRENSSKEREFYVKDVVRSTSAAPTYFQPAKIKNLVNGTVMINIDGGVFANNPAMCAFTECSKTKFNKNSEYPKIDDMIILSIGTGGGEPELPKSNILSWGIVGWAKSIPSIMMDGSIDTVHYQMKKIFESMSCDCKNYKRIDVPRSGKDYTRKYNNDMGDASKKNINDLKQAGKDAIKFALIGNDEEYGLNEFLKLLI